MNRGYTLIELLISITILMLFMGAGVAAFMTFNAKQQMVEAAKNVQNVMRTAQIKASAGDVPAGCTVLKSYRVNLVQDSSTVTLSAVCTNAVVPISSFDMPSQIRSNLNFQQDFMTLRGGVTPGGPIYLRTTWTTVPFYRYQFTISKAGGINDGLFY